MITTPQEYYSLLHLIQSNNAPTIALLPKQEKIYSINLEDRTIETPEFLSVEKDHASETVYFKTSRYFGCIDLVDTTCVVQYINADNEAYIYPVPFIDVQTLKDTNEILIPWNIGGSATKTAGTITYSIRFYRVDTTGKQFEYNLNTLPVSSKILHGMDPVDLQPDNFAIEPGDYLELVDRINQVSNQTILSWIDIYD